MEKENCENFEGDKNLCAVLYKKLDLRYEYRPIPTCKDDEVLLRVKSVGICGSDVHYWHNGACGRFVVTDPVILGHETGAEVVSVGAKVTSLVPGDRVAIEPGVPCRYCALCKLGRYNLCSQMEFHATPPVNGTLANFVTHPADFCFKLPDHLSFEEGALLEPFSVAVYGCQRSKVTNGSTVLICGAGPIGLASLITSKAMGAGKVAITDVSPSRLDYARELGADHCQLVGVGDGTKTEDDYVTEIHEALGGEPDAVIECAGPESSTRLAIKAARGQGSIATVGRGCLEPNISVVDVITKELNINGVFRYTNCFPKALALLREGKIPVHSFISHRFTLQDSEAAFRLAHSGQGVKIMINID